jgi:cytochrome c553
MKRAAMLVLMLACTAGAKPDAPDAANEGGTRIANAFHGALQDRSSKSPAEALFVEKCGMCHRQMGMGTVILARRMDPKLAMLEIRRDLSADFVTAAARQGIGNMPRISRAEVSDAQLATISTYLTTKEPTDASKE